MTRKQEQEREAREHGRMAYESGVSVDDYQEYPPYPVGSAASVAFWDGWHNAKERTAAFLDRMSDTTDGDTFDSPNIGL